MLNGEGAGAASLNRTNIMDKLKYHSYRNWDGIYHYYGFRIGSNRVGPYGASFSATISRSDGKWALTMSKGEPSGPHGHDDDRISLWCKFHNTKRAAMAHMFEFVEAAA